MPARRIHNPPTAPTPADDDDSGGSDDGSGDSDPQDGDDQGADNGFDAPPSCDPAGTGEVMDAPAGGGAERRRSVSGR